MTFQIVRVGIFFLLMQCIHSRNVLSIFEDEFSVEEIAIKAIENKNPAKAIAAIRSLIPEQERQQLDDDRSSPTAKARILIDGLAPFENRATLLGLYELATLQAMGIDLLKMGLFLSQTPGKDAGAMMENLMILLPSSHSMRDALDMITILASFTPDSEKKVARLTNEAFTMLLGVAGRLLVFDKDDNHKLDIVEIGQISDVDAMTIYDLLNVSETKLALLYKKSQDTTYDKIRDKVHDLNEKIQNVAGDDIPDKLRACLEELLHSASHELAKHNLENRLQAFVVTARDIRYPPKFSQAIAAKKRKELYVKQKQYLDLVQSAHVDELGWLKGGSECDGLLFNSLYAIAGGSPQILEARNADYQWFRSHQKDCYPTKSASTISRDMLIGLAFWAWSKRHDDVIDELIAYGKKHSDSVGQWVMGEGDEARIKTTKDLQETILLISAHLHGDSQRSSPQTTWFALSGYEAHLQVLEMLIRAQILGGMAKKELELLNRYHDRQPHNVLFSAIYHHYTDGDLTAAAEFLLDEEHFPAYQLPTTRQHCSPYLWERDEMENGSLSADWLPCPAVDRVTHPAIDFLFGSYLVLELFAEHKQKE